MSARDFNPFLEVCRCGKRRGLHRYGDEACPNRLWTCGNGQPQWLTIYYEAADMNLRSVWRPNTTIKTTASSDFPTNGSVERIDGIAELRHAG
jgi:hypothetical protein